MLHRIGITVTLLVSLALPPVVGRAQTYGCEDHLPVPPPVVATETTMKPAEPKPDPLALRTLKYAALATKHRLTGLASYYSRSLDGTLTATGEIFRNKRFTAAHLTLP